MTAVVAEFSFAIVPCCFQVAIKKSMKRIENFGCLIPEIHYNMEVPFLSSLLGIRRAKRGCKGEDYVLLEKIFASSSEFEF